MNNQRFIIIKVPKIFTACRFTERFSFLREDQVIHVVVDHLGDNVVHKNKAKDGVEW